ncbi:DEAD/DEAH box helicase family protein, partial [Candidatus Saccharibacteria bacterium]|nr:DEAD/DEAH box helicase family protein [Candidatus Saccharibacteria bacterium]
MLTVKGVAIHKPTPDLIEKARFTYKGPYIANKGRADAIEDLARHIGDDIWYIPRGLVPYDPNIKIRLPLPKLTCPVPKPRPEFSAFPNQKIVIKDLWNNCFCHDWGGRTLVYTTGGGKTYVSLRLALFRNTPTCIIEPMKPLVLQTHKEIKRYTTCETISTYASGLGKDYKPADNAYFTIMCIDSALKRPRAFFEQFGMVIFDEVHKYCQHIRAKIFTLAASRWMLAMTASPDARSDKRDPVYKLMVGPITVAEELPGFDHEEVVFHGTVYVIYYDTPEEYCGGLVEVKGNKSVTRTIAERLLPDD